jgi:hypothetical protein
MAHPSANLFPPLDATELHGIGQFILADPALDAGAVGAFGPSSKPHLRAPSALPSSIPSAEATGRGAEQHGRFRGPYTVVNAAFLREKANRTSDPRHVFYAAMLSGKTYEDYYAEVGHVVVEVASYRSGPITANMEIRYARKCRWIADT